MLKVDVINHFGTKSNTARALGISRAAVTLWEAVVPHKSAVQIEKLSGGKLKAKAEFYELRAADRFSRMVKTREDNYRAKRKAAAEARAKGAV